MRRERSILQRTVSFAGGNLLFLFGQFVFIALVAREGSPVLLGAYSLATAIFNPLFFFTKMGMRQAQATESGEEFTFHTYQRLRNIFLLAVAVLGVGISVTVGAVHGAIFVFMLVLASKIVEAMNDIYYGLLLQVEKQQIIAASLVLRSLAAIALFLVILNLTSDATLAMVGLPAGWFAVYLLHDHLRCRKILQTQQSGKTSPADLMGLFALLWPLAIAGFIGQTGVALPRYLIGWQLGVDVLGQVTPALHLHLMVGVFAQTVSQSLLPSVAKDIRNGHTDKARRRMVRLVLAAFPVLLFGIAISYFWGPVIVQLIFGDGYYLSGIYLWIVAVSWSFRAYGALFQNVSVSQRDFRKNLRLQIASFIAFAAFLGLGWWIGGLIGVFVGYTAGSAFQASVFLWDARRTLKPLAKSD